MKIPVGLSLFLAACLASASPAAAQVCGDYVRDPLEQCDDGNTRNLDGCDSACGFEQTQRMNVFQVRSDTSACANNRFGGAFNALGLISTNSGIAQGVQSGATSILLHFVGLDDVTGVNDPSLEVGVLSSAPLPGSGAYNGTNDSDWWHAVDKTLIDAQRVPVNRLSASLTSNALSATGAAVVKLVLGGGPASFSLTGIQLNVNTNAATTPASSTGLPPGHLALEHVDPALQSFGTAGTATALGFGTMCGNISALSLSQVVVPPTLRSGPGACTQAYTASNSLLDVLVGGCTVTGVGQAVAANTQPDTTVPATPSPGTAPFTFTVDGVTKQVTGCNDLSGPVDFATCLGHTAYSSYFRFTTNRVIAHDNAQFQDSFESGDMVAWSAASTDNGDLIVDPAGAMASTAQGLVGTINDQTPLFVEDQTPDNENRVRVRFYIDPTGFDPGELSFQRRTRVLIGFDDGSLRAFAVVLRRLNGNYSIMARARLDDGTRADTGFFPINVGPNSVEIDWIRSSDPSDPGVPDGRLSLSINGTVQTTLTALDNSVSSVAFIRFGALSLKSAADGTLAWDHYQANRMGPVGP